MVTATVNGGVRADVGVGDTVALEAVATTPPGGGTIVAVEWDFDGAGAFPVREEGVDGSRTEVRVARKTTFDVPGTYFPCVRVTAHRDGDVRSSQRRLVNLAG